MRELPERLIFVDVETTGLYPSRLDAVCDELGIVRGGRHGALTDAWHAAMVWMDLNGVDIGPLPNDPPNGFVPTNLRVAA